LLNIAEYIPIKVVSLLRDVSYVTTQKCSGLYNHQVLKCQMESHNDILKKKKPA
jgi:hypothetical protein